MPVPHITQCAWCTRIQTPSGEWTEPLGTKVHRFRRRPVTHGSCEECQEIVFAEAGLTPEVALAD